VTKGEDLATAAVMNAPTEAMMLLMLSDKEQQTFRQSLHSLRTDLNHILHSLYP